MGLISMAGYQLCFHKRHHEDGSGKCNMFQTGRVDDHVYGALYRMNGTEKPLLDQCEGEGYRCDSIIVNFQNNDYECFVYIAEDSHIDDSLRPHRWYREIVLLGAEFHHLPEVYLKQIRQITALDDPDNDRRSKNAELIQEMKAFRG